jgi:hypothetical protein
MNIQDLLDSYKKKLHSLNSEIEELFKFKNEEDEKLIEILKVKSECFAKFISDLEKIK